MNLAAYKELLSGFLSHSEKAVLAAFSQLKGAQTTDEYVYVPGSRKDRVLLVAHADTAGPIREPVWLGDVAVTKDWGTSKYGYGNSVVLGADDRAGCALMYNVFNGDHSLLITTGEERGCIGAKAAVKALGNELGKHQFALQVDRRGDRQAVFYDVATKSFKEYALKKLNQFDFNQVEWLEHIGSYTDIAHICDQVGICGVNLSAGYTNEHGSQEMLLLGAWLHTRTVVRRILQQPNIPKFVLPKVKYIVRKPVTTNPTPTGTTTTPITTSAETKVPLLVRFRNTVVPVHELSKKQKKILVKKVAKDYREGKISVEEAYSLVRQILPTKLHTVPISEEERAAFYTGEHWERRPVSPVHQEIGGSWQSRRLLAPPKCHHGVEQGRYCDRCFAVVGLNSHTLSHGKRQCIHGVPVIDPCGQCEAKLKPAVSPSLISNKVCEHGILLDDVCYECYYDGPQHSQPEMEEVERGEGEPIAEVVESHSSPPERRSLSPRGTELDFDRRVDMNDGYHIDGQEDSPFHIDH